MNFGIGLTTGFSNPSNQSDTFNPSVGTQELSQFYNWKLAQRQQLVQEANEYASLFKTQQLSSRRMTMEYENELAEINRLNGMDILSNRNFRENPELFAKIKNRIEFGYLNSKALQKDNEIKTKMHEVTQLFDAKQLSAEAYKKISERYNKWNNSNPNDGKNWDDNSWEAYDESEDVFNVDWINKVQNGDDALVQLKEGVKNLSLRDSSKESKVGAYTVVEKTVDPVDLKNLITAQMINNPDGYKSLLIKLGFFSEENSSNNLLDFDVLVRKMAEIADDNSIEIKDKLDNFSDINDRYKPLLDRIYNNISKLVQSEIKTETDEYRTSFKNSGSGNQEAELQKADFIYNMKPLAKEALDYGRRACQDYYLEPELRKIFEGTNANDFYNVNLGIASIPNATIDLTNVQGNAYGNNGASLRFTGSNEDDVNKRTLKTELIGKILINQQAVITQLCSQDAITLTIDNVPQEFDVIKDPKDVKSSCIRYNGKLLKISDMIMSTKATGAVNQIIASSMEGITDGMIEVLGSKVLNNFWTNNNGKLDFNDSAIKNQLNVHFAKLGKAGQELFNLNDPVRPGVAKTNRSGLQGRENLE